MNTHTPTAPRAVFSIASSFVSMMDESVKIRILVTHEGYKFLVLICPKKTVKDLKKELRKTYQENSTSGLLPESLSSDDLQLLAYDGHTLCDSFLVCDSLYDGCVVNTSVGNHTSCGDYCRHQRCCGCRNQVLAPTALQTTQSYVHHLNLLRNLPFASSSNHLYATSESGTEAPSTDRHLSNMVSTPPHPSILRRTTSVFTPPTSVEIQTSYSQSNTDQEHSLPPKDQNIVASDQASEDMEGTGTMLLVRETVPEVELEEQPIIEKVKQKVPPSMDVYSFDKHATDVPAISTPARKRKPNSQSASSDGTIGNSQQITEKSPTKKRPKVVKERSTGSNDVKVQLANSKSKGRKKGASKTSQKLEPTSKQKSKKSLTVKPQPRKRMAIKSTDTSVQKPSNHDDDSNSSWSSVDEDSNVKASTSGPVHSKETASASSNTVNTTINDALNTTFNVTTNANRTDTMSSASSTLNTASSTSNPAFNTLASNTENTASNIGNVVESSSAESSDVDVEVSGNTRKTPIKLKPISASFVEGSDSDSSSSSDDDDVREQEKNGKTIQSGKIEKTNVGTKHGLEPVEEEELSSDSNSSSSSDDEDNTSISNKKASESLKALSNDADTTLRTVQLKSSTMVPASSNMKKKLLQRTSLLKKGAPLSAANPNSSTLLVPSQDKAPKQTTTSVTIRKSRTRKQRPSEELSKEEEEMAMNLSQDVSNVSKVLNNEKLWQKLS